MFLQLYVCVCLTLHVPARVQYHGFDPVLLFLRRHLAMATLSSLRRFPRHDLHHELFMTETLAQVLRRRNLKDIPTDR